VVGEGVIEISLELQRVADRSQLYIYYRIIHEVHKRVIKLLTSAKSGRNERDIELFRTKINWSTTLATTAIT